MSEGTIDFDTAVDAIAGYIAALEPGTGRASSARRPYGADLFLRRIIDAYWGASEASGIAPTAPDRLCTIFADAAAWLVQIGVLRVGIAAPYGDETSGPVAGNLYSITEMGYRWAKEASNRPPSDPGRFMDVMAPLDNPVRGDVPAARRSGATGRASTSPTA